MSKKSFFNPLIGGRQLDLKNTGLSRLLFPLRSHRVLRSFSEGGSDGRGEAQGEVRVLVRLLVALQVYP